ISGREEHQLTLSMFEDPDARAAAIGTGKSQPVAVRRQVRPQISSRLAKRGFLLSAAIEPVDRELSTSHTPAVYKDSGSRKVKLRIAEDGRILHVWQRRNGCAARFQPVQVEWHGIQRTLIDINEMTAGQVTAVGPAAHESLPAAVSKREHLDV